MVPVVGGHHRHGRDGEILVDDIKGSGGPRPPGAEHRRRRLEGKGGTTGIECPVHQRQQAGAGVGVVHRRAEHKAVRLPRPFHKVVHKVLEHAAAQLPALAAGNAVWQRRVPDEKVLCLDAVVPQAPGHLVERHPGAAVFSGASVDQYDLHLLFPPDPPYPVSPGGALPPSGCCA